MSTLFANIQSLIQAGEVRISLHGYDELAEDGILVKEILGGAAVGTVIEEYPDYPKGPCVLVLQYDKDGEPLHAVWGVPRGA